MKSDFFRFLEYEPWVVGTFMAMVFVIIFSCMLGSFMGNQRSNAEALCNSLGGVYGTNQCYVEGELQPLEVDVKVTVEQK